MKQRPRVVDHMKRAVLPLTCAIGVFAGTFLAGNAASEEEDDTTVWCQGQNCIAKDTTVEGTCTWHAADPTHPEGPYCTSAKVETQYQNCKWCKTNSGKDCESYSTHTHNGTLCKERQRTAYCFPAASTSCDYTWPDFPLPWEMVPPTHDNECKSDRDHVPE
jgi:hypothetical protein